MIFPTELPFTKLQGIGNDFILFDACSLPWIKDFIFSSSQQWKQKIANRHYGIGADQILLITAPEEKDKDSSGHPCDFSFFIWNADGSPAEMCGNGIRAVSVYWNTKHPKKQYSIQTRAGIKTTSFPSSDSQEVQVTMGLPFFSAHRLPEGEKIDIQGKSFSFYEIHIGNPHAVFFFPSVQEIPSPFDQWGSLVENQSRFPEKTNVECVVCESPHQLRVKVWERGSGETLGCGTGACASAVASILSHRSTSPVTICLPGGKLTISWLGPGHPILMTGHASLVFSGVMNTNQFIDH